MSKRSGPGARSKSSEKNSRRAAAEQVKREHERKERRKTVLMFSGAGVAGVAILGAAFWGLQNEKEAASAPIENITAIEEQSASHVTEPIVATELPPTGGDHSGTVQNCGTYTEPVGNENALHSLEHGAVWLTYRPDVSQDEVAELDGRTSNETHVLVSPFPDQKSPVVATAWGRQIEMDAVSDPRLDTFMKRYVVGSQAPEPGAPCSGGVGTPG